MKRGMMMGGEKKRDAGARPFQLNATTIAHAKLISGRQDLIWPYLLALSGLTWPRITARRGGVGACWDAPPPGPDDGGSATTTSSLLMT